MKWLLHAHDVVHELRELGAEAQAVLERDWILYEEFTGLARDLAG